MWDLSKYFPKLIEYLNTRGIDTHVNNNSPCPIRDHKSSKPFRVGLGSSGDPVWTCFACGEGGTIFDLVAIIEGMPTLSESGFYDTTLQYLSDLLDIEMPERTGKKPTSQDLLLSNLYKATREIKSNIQLTDRVREFATSRGWSEETLRTFHVGEIPTFNKLYNRMSKKYSTQVLKYVGMYPRSFLSENRILFPMLDDMGRCIGFTGRVISATDSNRKYVNTSNSPIFKKSNVLYNLNRVKNNIKRGEVPSVYVVEGQADVLTLHQNGIENVVAISGTSFTDSHLQILKDIPSLICCLDADEGGTKATRKLYKKYNTFTKKDLLVLQLPEGKDPDEFVKEQGPSSFIKQEPMLPIEWEIRNTKSMSGLVAAEYWLEKISTQSTLHHDRILKVLSTKAGVEKSQLRSRLTQLNIDYILNNISKITEGDMDINVTIRNERRYDA